MTVIDSPEVDLDTVNEGELLNILNTTYPEIGREVVFYEGNEEPAIIQFSPSSSLGLEMIPRY
jgi:hypothetical protein